MSWIRRFVQHTAVLGLRFSGVLSLAKWWIRRRRAIVVLTFHRILPPDEFACTSSTPGMVASADAFQALAQYLSRECVALNLAGSEESRHSRHGRPRVLLTFDDGWLDTARVAYPIARKYGLPIAIFVCPGLTARHFPFWPERVVAHSRRRGEATAAALVERLKHQPAAERERWMDDLPAPEGEPMAATMTWDDIGTLAAGQVEFGSHTVNHEMLPRIPLALARDELTQSRETLRARLGSCDTFAYPNGDHSAEVRKLVQEAGYRWAFTTQPGLWTPESDPFLLPRVNVSEDKLRDGSGKFSPARFEYACFLKAALSDLRSSFRVIQKRWA